MIRILDEVMLEVANNLIENDGTSYYAIWDNVERDSSKDFFTAKSDKSYEDAAEQLWRKLGEWGANYGGTNIMFVHGDKGWETDDLYGAMRYIFDKGGLSFDQALLVIFMDAAGFEEPRIQRILTNR